MYIPLANVVVALSPSADEGVFGRPRTPWGRLS